ncbi:outer membrane beta-barrel protein [Kordia jejudonensis]|uniref:outer membrane beta-barrel protein n=1 Tax=Kordia jejudonensis TaxID=1348245 RepID=UPI00062982BE|nr:outer membrane beta-barrel protein [Kordia jejudonensis]
MTKNYITLFLLLLTTSGLFAQIKFEKGYFISNNGQKTDCYIKNVDWLNNPTDFTYKLTEDGKIQTGKLVAVKEFVIPTICKYEKHTVLIDVSNTDLSKLNYDKNPEWKEQTVFLNVLIEGKASLYRYKNGDLGKLFYKKDDGQIKQLIKKSYLSKDGELAENNEYRQQLYTDLACESISRNSVSRLRYNKNNITKFFIEYNECMNSDVTEYKQINKSKFHIRAEIGVLSQKTTLENASTLSGLGSHTSETEQQWSPRVGIDVEYVFGFNKNKWAVFAAPYYQSFKGESEFKAAPLRLTPDLKYEVEYAAIQFPVGVRHYMFLTDDSRIFLNAGIIMDLPLKREFRSEAASLNEDFRTSAGGILGIGFNYDKYYAEARITTSREIIENSANFSLNLNQFSFVLGYQFL